ncbi:MAG: cytochrome c oxidase assembly protein, partial [Candidatus Dormibacteria bacterium]
MPVVPPTVLTWNPLLLTGVGGCAVIGALLLRAAAASATPAELRWRWRSLATAVVLLLVAFVSPLATMAAHYWLTAHLLQLTLVMGVIPALLLLAVPPGVATPRWLRRATHPVVAIIVVNLVFFVWHASPLFDLALRHESLYALQQLSLLAVSLSFWWPIIEPRATGRRGLAPVPKLGYILLATIPQTFAGLVFALARHPFYAAYASAPRVLGLGVLTDQQIAGACLALLSKIALFAAFSVIFMRLLADDGDTGTDDDDGGR